MNRMRTKITDILKLMRVHHYIKNVLVFLPAVFAGRLTDSFILLQVIKAFGAFSMVSSAVYILNDIADLERDRAHPKKRERPLASGRVTTAEAYAVMAGCILTAGVLSFRNWNSGAGLCLLVYIVLNILYSKGLKNIPLIDVTILVSGFFLRVLYGSLVTGIPISKWLFLTIITISFYLGLGKRRNEIAIRREADGETRPALKKYTYAFLDKNMYMCLALAIMFYALWAADHEKTKMIMTVPLVIIASMRYSMDVEGNSDGDPTEIILHDRFLFGIALIYAAAVLALLYYPYL